MWGALLHGVSRISIVAPRRSALVSAVWMMELPSACSFRQLLGFEYSYRGRTRSISPLVRGGAAEVIILRRRGLLSVPKFPEVAVYWTGTVARLGRKC